MNWRRNKRLVSTSTEKTLPMADKEDTSNHGDKIVSDSDSPPEENIDTKVDEPEITPSTLPTAEVDGDAATPNLATTTSAVSTDSTTVYPKGYRLIVIFVSLCFAVFLVALDQTIIATAMYTLYNRNSDLIFSPRITNQFHSLEDVGWYASAYLLTSTSLQPTYGKIYQNFSLKWIFVGVVSIFELGSLICGIAPSSTSLIVGRAIAGLGAGGIFAGALTIIAYSVPLRTRPMFTGAIGAMFGVSELHVKIC